MVEAINALGMERYGSQFRIGESHDFCKNVFLLVGKENTQKLVPKPLLTHAFLFLMQLELARIFPSRFYACSFSFPWLGTHFCVAQWMGREIHDLGVYRGLLCPCNAYGWVECCSDIASFLGKLIFKISALCINYAMYLFSELL